VRRKNSSYCSPLSRRTIVRNAALASSVVASIPDGSAAQQPVLGQNLQQPYKHQPVCFYIDQSAGARDSRMIGRFLVQRDPQERSNAQRICGSPGHPALAVDALEASDHQQPKVNARRQTWPSQCLGIERLTQTLDKSVKPALIQNRFSRS
jgi:hypothetical protein